MCDPFNAFCRHLSVRLEGAPSGPLAGLGFAVKDLFDIAGHVTGAGNPDWLALHSAAARTAPVMQPLVDAGAMMVGKTHTDELSRGIFGENVHYGTPVNPRAPGRLLTIAFQVLRDGRCYERRGAQGEAASKNSRLS